MTVLLFFKLVAAAMIVVVALLRGVGGCAKAGRLHAIMDPSGSGKTSLLSGTCDRKLKLSGDLRADGVAVDKVEGAYVRQQDVFYPYLTVRETLTFSAMSSSVRYMPQGAILLIGLPCVSGLHSPRPACRHRTEPCPSSLCF